MTTPPEVVLDIDGTWNARDVATLTGLRPGVLYRTASLSGLTDSGRIRLAELGITDTIDLRGEGEVIVEGADAVPETITINRCPIGDGAQLSAQAAAQAHREGIQRTIAALNDSTLSEDFLVRTYASMMTSDAAVAAFGAGLRIIARPGSVCVVHCAAGKDRTGVLCALAATIAGAPAAAIDADYEQSNEAIYDQLQRMGDIADADPDRLRPLLGVDLRALHAAQQALIERFGSLAGFLEAAGVTEQHQDAIRAKLGPAR